MTLNSEDITTYFTNKKHQNKFILILLIIICAMKLPALLTSDIQPWDEGLYAVRVLSIYNFGDFFDQSSHSVANFISGSHPPLLIWIGFFTTKIFGVNEIALKLIPFVFALLCIIFIIKIGKEINTFETGFLSALIFSGTYLFSIYSKRFQFDIPVTFFILASFYYFILYLNNETKRYLIFSGIAFGFSLMTKSIVGLYFPIILFISYFFIRKKSNIKLSVLIFPVLTGLIIALPWHLYMAIKHGNVFTNYLFGFHLLSRALEYHEGIKPHGIHFYINLLLNNIPFSILLLTSLIKDAKNFVNLNWKKILLWIWFLAGLITISIFKTKLETYLLPFIVPACILIVLYLVEKQEKTSGEKIINIILIFFNIAWFITQYSRNEIKNYFMDIEYYKILLILLPLIAFVIILYYLSKKIVEKINFRTTGIAIIFVTFICLNIFYLIKIPDFENCYRLSDIKTEVEKSSRKKILYVSTEYKYNPQFTFYFEGIDIGWKNKFSYELADLKNGIKSIRSKLDELAKGEYMVIVERENINEGFYHNSNIFIPERFKLIKKTYGYELYEN